MISYRTSPGAIILMVLSLTIFSAGARAGDSNKRWNLDSGVALHGFDPVSYFQKDGPQKGLPEITATRDGSRFNFASKENAELFQKEPAKYLPAYGGWCAFAMAGADYVDVDPKTFKIKDGRLLLFYNGLFGNTLKKWNADEPNLAPKAEASWKQLEAGGFK